MVDNVRPVNLEPAYTRIPHTSFWVPISPLEMVGTRTFHPALLPACVFSRRPPASSLLVAARSSSDILTNVFMFKFGYSMKKQRQYP